LVQYVDLRLSPDLVEDTLAVRRAAARALGVAEEDIADVKVLRRSLDARPRPPVYQLHCAVYIGQEAEPEPVLSQAFCDVSEAPVLVIVGAGPAGYFAALECLMLGIKPIVLDRGLDARTRRRDLRAIQQFGEVNPESNYCFGEGGAGTYSDGKLYTRSVKRGKMASVLRLLVEHGAKSDILIDAHPHIGSNKLPGVIMNIRETIRHYGGEVRFGAKVNDLVLKEGRIQGVVLADGSVCEARAVMIATGHSARDVFLMFHRLGLALEFKPYALGVRIEHPQPLIDRIQYGRAERGNLPAASYGLTCQVGGQGVFSFCMCPGGLVVPAATSPGEIVVNGMSMSRRDSPYANAGTVVSVEWADLGPYHADGVFAGLHFQQEVEQTLFRFGDGSQRAPAQRLTDFADGRLSSDLPGTSYIPGIYPAPLHALLPAWIAAALRKGVRQFGHKMPGYFTREAVVVGTESRTSSPVRIPRDASTLMHPQVVGLFPSGEGAGYAGGILSAAMDGQNVARKVADFFGKRT
jgi:uncharacterized FAD-dependent dehydrogenase